MEPFELGSVELFMTKVGFTDPIVLDKEIFVVGTNIDADFADDFAVG